MEFDTNNFFSYYYYMAKVKNPLFSLSASGNIRKTLIFTSHQGNAIVKWYFKSPDARSHAQLLQRGIYSEAKDVWNGMSDEEKQPYQEQSETQYESGYSIFLSYYLLNYELITAFVFGWLISIFYGINLIIFSSVYRNEMLMNYLIGEGE